MPATRATAAKPVRSARDVIVTASAGAHLYSVCHGRHENPFSTRTENHQNSLLVIRDQQKFHNSQFSFLFSRFSQPPVPATVTTPVRPVRSNKASHDMRQAVNKGRLNTVLTTGCPWNPRRPFSPWANRQAPACGVITLAPRERKKRKTKKLAKIPPSRPLTFPLCHEGEKRPGTGR